MLFGRKDKRKPNERVEDLKARVDAMRQADEARRDRSYSLDHFLAGDDVLTGRDVEDNHETAGMSGEAQAAGSDGASDDYEAALAAELEKYLQREQERAQSVQEAGEPALREQEQPPTPILPPLERGWSRDGDRAGAPSDADRAWGLTGAAAPGSPEEGEEQEPEPGEDWQEFKNWPAEEDWPPKEQAG